LERHNRAIDFSLQRKVGKMNKGFTDLQYVNQLEAHMDEGGTTAAANVRDMIAAYRRAANSHDKLVNLLASIRDYAIAPELEETKARIDIVLDEVRGKWDWKEKQADDVVAAAR
jgi:hypothetical protein